MARLLGKIIPWKRGEEGKLNDLVKTLKECNIHQNTWNGGNDQTAAYVVEGPKD